MNIWQILEIEQTYELSIIKQAYVKKLKTCKPEIDPDGFKTLRIAYELAVKFAAGEKVNVTFDTTQSADASLQESGPVSYKDPIKAVGFLLDELIQDEEKAINLLNFLHKNKYFDNLDYLEVFQRNLVINLLVFTPMFSYFVCDVIHFFKLDEQLEYKNDNDIYTLALKNLVNNSKPYSYIRTLSYYSKIKTRQEAQLNQIDWYDCCAARILLNPINFVESFFIALFKGKHANAIFSHVTRIKQHFPQAVGLGMNLTSVDWWYDVKSIGLRKATLARIIHFSISPLTFFVKIVENPRESIERLIYPIILIMASLYVLRDPLSDMLSSFSSLNSPSQTYARPNSIPVVATPIAKPYKKNINSKQESSFAHAVVDHSIELKKSSNRNNPPGINTNMNAGLLEMAKPYGEGYKYIHYEN